MENKEIILNFIRGAGNSGGNVAGNSGGNSGKNGAGYGNGNYDGTGDGSGCGYGYGNGNYDGTGDGSGCGYGYGNGNYDGTGDGSGCGYDSGNGNYDGTGDGSGCGYGYGNGNGSGRGSGNGYGNGCGDGDGSGNGDGYSYGDNSLKFNCKSVYYVDKIPTIFEKIKGNVAHCQIINKDDFSVNKCFLVRGNGQFAHGDTLTEAKNALREKIFSRLNTEQRIEEFKKQFNGKDRYSANDFFEWHNILTGSCLTGRKYFIENHNIDMKRKYTVKEFIEICENDYGGEIIKGLKVYYR